MKTIKIASVALIAIISSIPAHAKTLRMLKASSAGSSIEFVADSIQYRSDVTRLYGKLKGRPHTSNRIDVLKGTFGKITYSSTDIDGVDMKRWFQWEDDGLIPVEIDFPVMRPSTEFTLDLEGPKGNSRWNVSAPKQQKTASRHNKR